MVTASGGALTVAIVEAVLVELPLATLLVYIPWHAPLVNAGGLDDCSRRRIPRRS
jgi:hypothetical protein